jgi:hypothetical protein
MTSDGKHEGDLPGRAGLKQAFEIFWKATPGYHKIEDLSATTTTITPAARS